jgi:D-psicose/D-tagatose/L-ribulose 3-epimerase
MKFGVTSYLWSAEFGPDQLSLLPRIKAWGFDGVEVPLFRPREFASAEIRRGFESEQLECVASSVLTGDLSLISDDASVRRKTVRHLEDVIKAAADAGARIIAGPLYSPVGHLVGRRRTPEEWSHAIEGYQAIASTLAAHEVTLAIEPLNRFETFFLNTAADAAALCDAVADPRIGVLLDTFHANIEEKDVATAFRTAGSRLQHVHTCENDRGTPGNGHVDWPGVFQALHDVRYDGWLTIESFGFTLGDLSAAAAIWRDIEADADSIARDGILFLKGNVPPR